MLLLITVVFLLNRYSTHAVPLPVPTPESSTFEMPIFPRDDPPDVCNTRTVFDILWSCLATTFACTWVSVHPNVPFKGEGSWTLLRRRLFLMFFSILAPEFMIMWAFKQWRGAVMIREAVNDAIKEASPDSQNPIRSPWTTTHGHLLQMGGFRLIATQRENFFCKGLGPVLRSAYPRESNLGNVTTISSSRSEDLIPGEFYYRRQISEASWTTDYTPDNELNDNIWEGVLTINSLKQLLSENLIRFPTISEDEINDRGKGDALSKGLAFLQLTWFIVQIITRAAQGLAITELELTTAALAGLNSVMYIFWWSKPRDVRFPVLVQTKIAEKLLANNSEDVAWSFPSTESAFDFRKHLWKSSTTAIKGHFDALSYFVVSFPFHVVSFVLYSVEKVKAFPVRFARQLSRTRYLFSAMRTQVTDEKNAGTEQSFHEKCSTSSQYTIECETRTESIIQSTTHILIIGAKFAMRTAALPIFYTLYLLDLTLFIPTTKIMKASSNGGMSTYMANYDTGAESRILTMMFSSEDASVRPLLSASCIAGALFGAVHCLAWNFSFPSHVEQIMWVTASLCITCACAALFVATYLASLLEYLCDQGNDYWNTVKRLGGILGNLLVATVSFLYPVARITLLVLAFTSIRSLPPSALDTVDWVELVPHI